MDETPALETAPANPRRQERTARLLEYAAFLDELDHPQTLLEAISLLMQELHATNPGLLHSSEWVASGARAEKDTVDEARWRGATAQAIATLGSSEAVKRIEQAEAIRS